MLVGKIIELNPKRDQSGRGLSFLTITEGPLYPFAKLNHVKIFGLFTRHE